MSERSEYDVVSFKPRAGFLSLLCAVVPLAFGILADELPGLLGGLLRPYYGYIYLTSTGLCVVGIVVGALGLRRPDDRAVARMGILVNGIILILFVLFLLIFRWIRWGSLTWF